MITLKNVTKSYGNNQVLDHVTIDMESGSVLTLVGPSGGGKTTLLRCISGLETMDSGEIIIDNQPISFKDHPGRIGVVFQDFNLFPHLTVLDNLILAPTTVKKMDKSVAITQAKERLEAFGLKEHIYHYPSQLSGGQKQRIAIARALLMKPDILCYDEPTSALDPSLVDYIAETIRQLKEDGMSQIVVTHDMVFAEKIADQLINIDTKK